MGTHEIGEVPRPVARVRPTDAATNASPKNITPRRKIMLGTVRSKKRCHWVLTFMQILSNQRRIPNGTTDRMRSDAKTHEHVPGQPAYMQNKNYAHGIRLLYACLVKLAFYSVKCWYRIKKPQQTKTIRGMYELSGITKRNQE